MTIENLKSVIGKGFGPDEVKSREVLGKAVPYVPTDSYIKALNEAFDYQWSFEILEEKVVESLPKKEYARDDREKKNPITVPQAPYLQVLGKLSIPSLNIVKVQYGTKIILGGATEQEGVAKAAASDALKKCATLLGIGLDIQLPANQNNSYNNGYKKSYNNYNNNYNSNYNNYKYNNHTADSNQPSVNSYKATQTATTQQQPVQVTTSQTTFDSKSIEKIKVLKAQLGISSNSQLDPFIQEYMNDKTANYNSITPNNINGVISFLQTKING